MVALSLPQIARALGGELVRNQVLCPGPGHSQRDRSLAVRPSSGAPDGLLIYSHCGDDWRDCRDFVLGKLEIERKNNQRQLAKPHNRIRYKVECPLSAPPDHDDINARIQRVHAIWDEARDPRGTVVEAYLTRRELGLTDDLAEVIRFHPACPWSTGRLPAMVAAFRCIHTDRITGIHRTALTPNGTKIGRKMLGIVAGAAIKLDPDEAVTGGLTIGEGIETTLSARQFGIKPAWALGSVGALASFPVLSGIEALTLLAEEDTSGASQKAIKECGHRWHQAKREVITAASKVGGDLNDALLGSVP
ncbi:toprim domain-containing protein [Microvirga sp. BT689]|uniref:DUF7146 domain-containing protein n=1 Tax=Microvirga arvi TaxID=2778731 RepID=UPI0019527299|nr:toprim domain-containing protein [Microvirga arvi]MBM6582985.1 toprim domain-containing protein [Microvirga arvi]